MKRNIILFGIIAIFMSMAHEVSALSPEEKNDSLTTVLKLNSLQSKKESLQKEIKLQDAKRNQQIAGVSAETMENINNRQDSLCLALRSELVDVILEIKELSPRVTSPQLLNQFNEMVNRPDSIQTTTVATASPVKSTKKESTDTEK